MLPAYARAATSKVLPLTLPLAYLFTPDEKLRGGGKFVDVGNVCGPEEGGGDGTE